MTTSTFMRFVPRSLSAAGKVLAVTALSASMLASAPLAAHHSFIAVYDPVKTFKVSGTVSTVRFVNPHTTFDVDVVEGGKTNTYTFELSSMVTLLRVGWTRKSLQVGDKITVEGARARNNPHEGFARSIVANGKKLTAM